VAQRASAVIKCGYQAVCVDRLVVLLALSVVFYLVLAMSRAIALASAVTGLGLWAE